MFERYREREEVREGIFSKGTGYLLYKIVDTCVDASFPMLRKMGAKLDQLEDDIFEGRSDKIVQDISNAKQEIINFRRVVRPMRAVLRDLERTKQRYLQEDLDIYFDDITDAAERIWDVLENYKEVAEALEDSNESVLSHRLNESLRVLTAFSVAMLPLTLLASVFGMNVPLPGQPGSPSEFWVIVALMAAIAARRAAVLPPPRLPVARVDPESRQAVVHDAARRACARGSRLGGLRLAARHGPRRGAGAERRRPGVHRRDARRRGRRVLADRGLDGAHRDPDPRPDRARRGALAIARAELPMLSAAVIPTILLLTASFGLTTPDQAANLAMAAGIVQLFAWGLVVGLAMRRGWRPALVVALVDVGLGLVIVTLKVAVLALAPPGRAAARRSPTVNTIAAEASAPSRSGRRVRPRRRDRGLSWRPGGRFSPHAFTSSEHDVRRLRLGERPLSRARRTGRRGGSAGCSRPARSRGPSSRRGGRGRTSPGTGPA